MISINILEELVQVPGQDIIYKKAEKTIRFCGIKIYGCKVHIQLDNDDEEKEPPLIQGFSHGVNLIKVGE